MLVSRMFAISFAVAVGTMSSATAEPAGAGETSQGIHPSRAAPRGPTAAPSIPSEATSFIARVERSQGIHPSGMAPRAPTAAPSIPTEATSFLARVEASQGIYPSGAAPRAPTVAPSIPIEASSFVARVELSQGIPVRAGYEAAEQQR